MSDTDDSGLDFDILALDVGVQIHLTRRALWLGLDRSKMFRGSRQPGGFVSAFIMIDANPGITQKRLAEALFLDAGAIGDIVDLLEKDELVERRRDPADRRRMNLFVTPAGVEQLRQIKMWAQLRSEKIAACLTEEERTLLIELLQRLRDQARQQTD
ncbi:MAG: winged helix-turn-helix transcriptional regulator [Sphingobium sp.]|nr:winged helix-turn-helix transcriptional regulator [Sphingobium sp.]